MIKKLLKLLKQHRDRLAKMPHETYQRIGNAIQNAGGTMIAVGTIGMIVTEHKFRTTEALFVVLLGALFFAQGTAMDLKAVTNSKE